MINTILLILGITLIGFLGYRILQRLEKPSDDQGLKMLQDHLFEIQKGIQAQDKSINEQMNKSRDVMAESLQKQFATSQQIIKEVTENVKSVTEKLTTLDATNKQVVGFAEQMKS